MATGYIPRTRMFDVDDAPVARVASLCAPQHYDPEMRVTGFDAVADVAPDARDIAEARRLGFRMAEAA